MSLGFARDQAAYQILQDDRQYHGDLPGGIGRYEEASQEAGTRPFEDIIAVLASTVRAAGLRAWWMISSCKARRASQAIDLLTRISPPACHPPMG